MSATLDRPSRDQKPWGGGVAPVWPWVNIRSVQIRFNEKRKDWRNRRESQLLLLEDIAQVGY